MLQSFRQDLAMNRLPLRIAVFLLGVAAAFPAPGDDAAAPSMKPGET